jgi:hypothetical protein
MAHALSEITASRVVKAGGVTALSSQDMKFDEIKANPTTRTDTHNRVRRDRIDQAGVITVRLGGRLHHIGVGRTYTATRVLVLIQDLNIRIIHAATGEMLRELTLDPTRDYQPTGAPKGPKRKKFRT